MRVVRAERRLRVGVLAALVGIATHAPFFIACGSTSDAPSRGGGGGGALGGADAGGALGAGAGAGGTAGVGAAGGGGTAGAGATGGAAAGASAAGGRAAGAGGRIAAGGSSGTTAAGGKSPGTVTVQFTTAGPDPYCMNVMGCEAGPSIDVVDAMGRSLFAVTSSCTDFDCNTCQASPCPGYYCPPGMRAVVVTGAQLVWDGSYYVRSTCGAGAACVAKAYAAPGKYTAKMCATPGNIMAQGTSAGLCVFSGAQKCSSVDFDLPPSSTATLMGTIGP